MALEYLCQLVSVYNPERTLRSSGKYLFIRKEPFLGLPLNCVTDEKKKTFQFTDFYSNLKHTWSVHGYTWQYIAMQGNKWQYIAIHGYTRNTCQYM